MEDVLHLAPKAGPIDKSRHVDSETSWCGADFYLNLLCSKASYLRDSMKKWKDFLEN